MSTVPNPAARRTRRLGRARRSTGWPTSSTVIDAVGRDRLRQPVRRATCWASTPERGRRPQHRRLPAPRRPDPGAAGGGDDGRPHARRAGDAGGLPARAARRHVVPGRDQRLDAAGPRRRRPDAGLVVIIGRYSGDRDLSGPDHGAADSGRDPATEVIEPDPRVRPVAPPQRPLRRVLHRRRRRAPRRPAAGWPASWRPSTWPAPRGSGRPSRARRSPPRSTTCPELRRAAARGRGLVECWVVPGRRSAVTGVPATIVAWGRDGGSVMEVHRYAARDDGPAAHPDPAVAPAGHDPAPGRPPRSAHRPDQPIGLPRAARGRPASAASRPASACSTSTSTGSRASTTSTATGSATPCWPRSASGSPRVLRPGDVVGRLGGDEFAVLCPHLVDRRRRRRHRRAGGGRRSQLPFARRRRAGHHRGQRRHRHRRARRARRRASSSTPPTGRSTRPRARVGAAGTCCPRPPEPAPTRRVRGCRAGAPAGPSTGRRSATDRLRFRP